MCSGERQFARGLKSPPELCLRYGLSGLRSATRAPRRKFLLLANKRRRECKSCRQPAIASIGQFKASARPSNDEFHDRQAKTAALPPSFATAYETARYSTNLFLVDARPFIQH